LSDLQPTGIIKSYRDCLQGKNKERGKKKGKITGRERNGAKCRSKNQNRKKEEGFRSKDRKENASVLERGRGFVGSVGRSSTR